MAFLRPMHPGGDGKEASSGRREAGGEAANGGGCVTSLEVGGEQFKDFFR